ncbi:SLBB domain-containing protein [Botrimarina mediterranea]|uniref:polysaccharide biosynthesis/export family protein n=1 Tax=Botrimarina mediterranea TaxID=2528022 RepID=UPI0011A28B75
MPASCRDKLAPVLMSLAVLSAIGGCSSPRLQARSLPAEFRAARDLGQQRVQLSAFSSVSRPSKAIDIDDRVVVRIVTGLAGEEPIEQEVRVTRDGSIDTLHVGRVVIAGLEPAAAAEQIASAAVARGVFVRPQISVELTEPATNQITVLGAVSEPGVKELPRSGCDVLSAIAAAGGLSEEAGAVVELQRGGSHRVAEGKATDSAGGVQQVSFNAPGEDQMASSPGAEVIDLSHPESTSPDRMKLSDRDVIIVRPRQKRFVHVTGLVKTPKQFELIDEHDMRVLDAIAMAGGASSVIADKVLLVRQTAQQAEPLLIEVSLNRAKRDGAENLILQSGDLVSVESTPATAALDTFSTLFRVTMGVGGNLTLF